MKKIEITIITREDEPEVIETLQLIADQVADGFTSGMDRNDDERYHFTVSATSEDALD